MKIVLRVGFSLFFFLLLAGSSSAHISYNALESHASTSRSLLQAKTPCPEDFANKNYTVITSQCKGPNYPADACCKAFKEFACPFAESINDEKNDCASTMFSYINLYGRYPPGIFANMCKEDKNGLDCEAVKPPASSSQTTARSTLLDLATSFLVLLSLML